MGKKQWRFTPPPNWPPPPPGWVPPQDWHPDPEWPEPPEGWVFWVEESNVMVKRGENAITGTVMSAVHRISDVVTTHRDDAQDGLVAGRQQISADHSFFTPDDLWQAEGRPLSGVGKGRYRVTERHLFFEKGTLSMRSHQVDVADLYDIDVRQTLTQKTRGVGTIIVAVRRDGADERVLLEEILNFREGQQVLNRVSHEARVRVQQYKAALSNTHRTENIHRVEGAAFTPPGVPTASPEQVSDPIEQLRRLGELRDAGVLTVDDFEAKKADILRRL